MYPSRPVVNSCVFLSPNFGLRKVLLELVRVDRSDRRGLGGFAHDHVDRFLHERELLAQGYTCPGVFDCSLALHVSDEGRGLEAGDQVASAAHRDDHDGRARVSIEPEGPTEFRLPELLDLLGFRSLGLGVSLNEVGPNLDGVEVGALGLGRGGRGDAEDEAEEDGADDELGHDFSSRKMK